MVDVLQNTQSFSRHNYNQCFYCTCIFEQKQLYIDAVQVAV